MNLFAYLNIQIRPQLRMLKLFCLAIFMLKTPGRHDQSIAHRGLKLAMGDLWGGHILFFEG